MAKAKQGGNGLKIGLGLAAVAAAAAGAYYFYGKDGAKNRKHLKSWAVKAKGEVMEKLEMMPEVTETAYHQVVAEVLKRYKTIKHVAPAELSALSKELLSHWQAIKSEVQKAGKRTSAKVRK